MKIKILSLTPLLSMVFAQNASAFCDSMTTRVYVDTMPGNPTYITTKSRQDFIQGAHQKVSPNTLGLTVAELSVSGEPSIETNIPRQGDAYCASLGTIRFKMGYKTGDLKVFIDKKYKPGSCEYELVKKHENYHVQVSQQAMRFFKKDVENQIYKTISSLKPQKVYTPDEYSDVVQKQYNQIMHDLAPLIKHINTTIAEKNYKIDTPEAYKAQTALCNNW